MMHCVILDCIYYALADLLHHEGVHSLYYDFRSSFLPGNFLLPHHPYPFMIITMFSSNDNVLYYYCILHNTYYVIIDLSQTVGLRQGTRRRRQCSRDHYHLQCVGRALSALWCKFRMLCLCVFAVPRDEYCVVHSR
jgi:hypothetical protein